MLTPAAMRALVAPFVAAQESQAQLRATVDAAAKTRLRMSPDIRGASHPHDPDCHVADNGPRRPGAHPGERQLRAFTVPQGRQIEFGNPYPPLVNFYFL